MYSFIQEYLLHVIVICFFNALIFFVYIAVNLRFLISTYLAYCKICEADKKTASLFSKEFDCNLCDNCISDHNNFKLTRNHEMELLKLTE